MNNTFKYSCINKNIDSVFVRYRQYETSVRVHRSLNCQPCGRKVLRVKYGGVVILITTEC
jgi:hypothetical protein